MGAYHEAQTISLQHAPYHVSIIHHALRPSYTRWRPLHGSKRPALVYLFGGLVLVLMLIMAAVSAAGLALQPLTVRRATFAPRAFSMCVEGCCEYFTVP